MDNIEKYIGKTFGGRYTVINIIGDGENSVVFGAYDTREDRTVALKILRPEYNCDTAVAERFATEAELMSMLSHPNIVKIYDTCLDGDIRYFAMEYVEGITLKKHILGKGPLPTDEILFLSRQILSALAAIHEKGIVHSDIKPQNVVVLPDGHICLMDFGISKRHTEIDPNDTTFGGIFNDYSVYDGGDSSDLAVGTVHYVSPEQAEGREIDHRSDLYSFGVMLYEMATGTLPFFAESAQEIALMHVRAMPEPPSWREPSIPEELEKIILRTLEKLPIARFASAEDIQKALDDFAEEPLELPPVEESERISPLQRIRDLFDEYFRDFNLPSFILGMLCALLVSVVISLGILSEALINERQDPNYVKVPDLESRLLTNVLNDLDNDCYHFEITYVTDHNNPGRILKQSPSEGNVKRVSESEKCVIKLTVARRDLPPTMPDFRNLSRDEVAEALRAYECNVQVVEQPHALVKKGTVLSTSPASGQPTSRDITLFVSSGWQQNNEDIE